ncbi:hypothetical protein SLEP1_g44347 [Rubroshorea leprosula]|uniref:Uncharacterized protein n=1 Tax=Rubroshorea leprosula TaxID=152421 RepID=A0AAV5LHT2_9ROSI|nr:hypothetical protein SLEP1_g44347 [Rubroshorea leprosula]
MLKHREGADGESSDSLLFEDKELLQYKGKASLLSNTYFLQ